LLRQSGGALSLNKVCISQDEPFNPLMKDIDTEKDDPADCAGACADAKVDSCETSRFRRAGIALFRDSERLHIHHHHVHEIAAYPVLLGNGTGDGHVIEANRIKCARQAMTNNGSRGNAPF
jgi:hypothetical protein